MCVYVCYIDTKFLKILENASIFFFMLLELEAREREVLKNTRGTPRWSFWTKASSRKPSSH